MEIEVDLHLAVAAERIKSAILRREYREAQNRIIALAAMSPDEHRFRGFRSVNDLPLSMAILDDDHLLSSLDNQGVVTVGDCRRMADRDLLAIWTVGPRQLKRIRESVEMLIGDYVNWTIRTGG